jgi:hypothetical protein
MKDGGDIIENLHSFDNYIYFQQSFSAFPISHGEGARRADGEAEENVISISIFPLKIILFNLFHNTKDHL